VGSVDFVYEAVGFSQLAFRAMKMLGPNSLFVFTGVPALNAPSDVDTDAIIRDAVLINQVILGTVNAGQAEYHVAIRTLASISQRWPAAVQALISGRYPPDAYRDLLLQSAGGIKKVLSVDTAYLRTSQPTVAAALSSEHHYTLGAALFVVAARQQTIKASPVGSKAHSRQWAPHARARRAEYVPCPMSDLSAVRWFVVIL
jgi:Glucose dehydrogenase C-terminus